MSTTKDTKRIRMEPDGPHASACAIQRDPQRGIEQQCSETFVHFVSFVVNPPCLKRACRSIRTADATVGYSGAISSTT